MEFATLIAALPPWLADIAIKMEPAQWLMTLAFPLILFVAAVEWWHFRGTDKFELRDSLASTVMGGTYGILAEGVMVAILVMPVLTWFSQFRFATIELTPWTFFLLFIVVDFFFYVFHLTAHRVRFFWAVHEVHHASEYFNFTVAFRQSVMYAVTGNFLFYVPIVLIGFSPEAIWGMLAANLLTQIFLHTQWVGRLPAIIEGIFNTPSSHRVHHGRNPQYIDRNMGGTLIIWDRLFGTYTAEDPANPPDYGVVRPVETYNLITLTFKEFAAMFRDMAQPGPLSQRLKHLWAPPEWERTPTLPATK